MIHLGWTIALDQHAPVTGRWKATKHGVQMGAGTYGALVKMIERKVQEGYWPAAWRRKLVKLTPRGEALRDELQRINDAYCKPNNRGDKG